MRFFLYCFDEIRSADFDCSLDGSHTSCRRLHFVSITGNRRKIASLTKMNNENIGSSSGSGSGSVGNTTSSRSHEYVGSRTNYNNNTSSGGDVYNVNNNTPRKKKCETCGKFHKPPCRYASQGNNDSNNNNGIGIGYGYGSTPPPPTSNNATSTTTIGYGYGNLSSPPTNNNNNNNTSTITSSRNNNSGSRNTRKERRQKRMTANTKIYTGRNNFLKMHRMCGAVRYKVHKPKCDCPKLIQLIKTIDYSYDSDDVIIEGGGGGGGIDGLVVVPDNKQRVIYLCSGTNQDIFNDDPRMAELKLRDEIFSSSKIVSSSDADEYADAGVYVDVETIATATTVVDESQFKVSCASCLLTANEPNGFCLVTSSSSTSLDLVDAVRDRSRSRKEEKEAIGEALHPDHAHFVARLPRSSLWKLSQSKTRSQTSQALDKIFLHLSGQGIDTNIINDDNNIERYTNGIELGHHLSSLLNLTDVTSNQRYDGNDADADANANTNGDYWLVLGYDDTKSLMLDLPGGKRHLGETSLEGAIRETEEEMSLIWDPSWVVQTVQGKKKSDLGNRYFFISPSSSSI
jgi:hypothetical protein